MKELLGSKAVLCREAQTELLTEVEEMFTQMDNEMLEKKPSKKEIIEVLKEANLNSAPGALTASPFSSTASTWTSRATPCAT